MKKTVAMIAGVSVLAGGTPVTEAVVIGTDSRVRTNPTTTFPYNAIGSIDRPGGGVDSDCTGWFFAANGVATAGHCVWDGSYFGNDQEFTFAPGRFDANDTSSSKPYGFCVSNRRRVPPEWIAGLGGIYDYAALRVDCAPYGGVPTGPFAIASTISTNAQVEVAGYPVGTNAPAGSTQGQQWKGAGMTLTTINSGARITYDVDTSGGQSGSPVFYNGGGWDNQVLAIHTGAAVAGSNSGVVLSSSVMSRLNGWLV